MLLNLSTPIYFDNVMHFNQQFVYKIKVFYIYFINLFLFYYKTNNFLMFSIKQEQNKEKFRMTP